MYVYYIIINYIYIEGFEGNVKAYQKEFKRALVQEVQLRVRLPSVVTISPVQVRASL